MVATALVALAAPRCFLEQSNLHFFDFRVVVFVALLFGSATERSSASFAGCGASTYSTRPIAVRERAFSSDKFKISPALQRELSMTQDFKTRYGI
jgi:hypothetical protein